MKTIAILFMMILLVGCSNYEVVKKEQTSDQKQISKVKTSDQKQISKVKELTGVGLILGGSSMIAYSMWVNKIQDDVENITNTTNERPQSILFWGGAFTTLIGFILILP